MLLAKIRDVLLNRRNKIEVEDMEVKGEIPASLIQLIQQNGIAFDKQYIFVDDEVQLIDVVPEDYTGCSYLFGSDGLSYIEDYLSGELVNQTVLSYNNFNIDGISFSQKATVWEVENAFTVLASWLDENASKLKAGDIIISSDDGYMGSIETYGVETELYIRSLQDEKVILYVYAYNENDGWSLDNEYRTPIGGTKLYKHTLTPSQSSQLDFEITVITNTSIRFDTLSDTDIIALIQQWYGYANNISDQSRGKILECDLVNQKINIIYNISADDISFTNQDIQDTVTPLY